MIDFEESPDEADGDDEAELEESDSDEIFFGQGASSVKLWLDIEEEEFTDTESSEGIGDNFGEFRDEEEDGSIVEVDGDIQREDSEVEGEEVGELVGEGEREDEEELFGVIFKDGEE